MYYLAPIPRPPAVAAVAEEAAAAATAAADSSARKHLKWKKCGSGVPSVSSLTLPTITADDELYMDQRFTMSPNLPGGAAGFLGTTGMFHPAAAAAAAAAAAYGFGCSPGVVLERLGPHILRSHVSTVQSKPIPHNDGIDLEAFKRKDPREWNMDDVIGWMISVAKTRGIPVEDMNMHRFASCTGPLLSLMNQQNFVERDSTYGSLLYYEFRKLLGCESSSFLDHWERLQRDEPLPGPSGLGGSCSGVPTTNDLLTSLAAATEAAAVATSIYNRMISNSRAEADDVDRHCSFHQRESVIKAAGTSTAPPSSSLPGVPDGCLGVLPDLRTVQEMRNRPELTDTNLEKMPVLLPHVDPVVSQLSQHRHHQRRTVTESISLAANNSGPKFMDGKIIKKKLNDPPAGGSITLSGKPRKRSQHTRGNKLWEFIRSALRDQRTCPSVVKWEDESEGVFRIVESEKLARLWGEKKNNKKMTYEKLSRAMRTYYEKQILVPVPKTGLYPKKLVYKFGPNARGWQQKDLPSSSSSSTTTIPSLPYNERPSTKPIVQTGQTIMLDKCEMPQSGSSSSFLPSAVPIMSGLLSLADVASRQLLTALQAGPVGCNNEEDNEDERMDTGKDGITVAIEETMVTVDDEDEEADDGDDTPPPLLE